jgi:hypothetical protein
MGICEALTSLADVVADDGGGDGNRSVVLNDEFGACLGIPSGRLVIALRWI